MNVGLCLGYLYLTDSRNGGHVLILLASAKLYALKEVYGFTHAFMHQEWKVGDL